MKRDIRDGKNYKKQGKQEAAYPIPISLAPMPHCLVTVLQRYWDGVCSLFFHLFFIIIPLLLKCLRINSTENYARTIGKLIALKCKTLGAKCK